MKLPVAIATLFLATTTALPAFAATALSPSLDGAAAASVETVQYRPQQMPRQNQHYQPNRYRSGYDAYAAAPPATTPGRNVIPGWRCAYRDESSEYSAYPAWEICN